MARFEESKRYSFSIEKYTEWCKSKGVATSIWSDECKDKEVGLYRENIGIIDGFLVSPTWCIEI